MIGLQGILFDEKSSYLRGAAKAPPVIRECLKSDSANLFSESGLDISEVPINDHGDFIISSYFDIYDITLKNAASDKLITLGGDHSISYPIVKAIHENQGEFDILHIDAHSDLYDEFEGDRFSHACPFARIMEDGLAHKLVQVGIRTLTAHQREMADKFGVEIIEMKDYRIESVPSFDRPLYISVDMDAFDPAFAPGIAHHEPGGFSSRQVIDLLLAMDQEIIGADIVEFNPDRDLNGMTGMLTAKLLKELIALMA